MARRRPAVRSGSSPQAGDGLSTPLLLQRSGIEEAGKACFMDPAVVICGEAPLKGTWADPPVSVVTWEFYDNDRIRIATIMEPGVLQAMNLLRTSPRQLGLTLKGKNLVGILVRVKDDLSSRVHTAGIV